MSVGWSIGVGFEPITGVSPIGLSSFIMFTSFFGHFRSVPVNCYKGYSAEKSITYLLTLPK